MSSAKGAHEASFGDLRLEWCATRPGSDWENEFSRLTDEWRAVEWRSGGKTLLSALGLQFQEVPLCRGLAWLLDPQGGHRLGRHPLHAFLRDLGLPVIDDAPVEMRVEEARDDSRADIVIRVGRQTVLVEAKVHAGEQPRQADRLHERWAAEDLTLVFLTRDGRAPYTALRSEAVWVTRSWRDVARLLRGVAGTAGLQPSAGAREFIETVGAL